MEQEGEVTNYSTQIRKIIAHGTTDIEVIYTDDNYEATKIVDMYEQWLSKDDHKFMGLDFEYCDPEDENDYRIAVVQLAMKNHVLVYQWSRFMLEVFDPATGTFVIGDTNDAVSLGFVEVECLLAATRRDNFDYENGRGRGNVKIDENITEEYQMQEPVVPDPMPARQEKAKPASALPKKKQAPKPIDNDQTEFLINRLTGYLDQQLHKLLAPIPSLCTQRTLEIFNKEGVTYKLAAAAVSGNMEDEEDANSFQNGPRDKKEFMYKEESDSEGGRARVCSIVDMTLPDEGEEHGTHVKEPAENGTAKNANDAMRTPAKASGLNGRTPDKPFGDLGSTPDNPFIIDNVDPVTSDSEIDIDAVTISKFISKAKEDEFVGKRKRTVPKKFQSPYALDRRTKRQVIDGYIGHLALHVGHDRFLCPAWRSKYLVDRANAGDKPQDSSKNMDSAMVRSGAVGRVLAEYTVRDKVYFSLNIGNTHWMTVVMHIPKEEFQVLDSLYPLDFTLETVQRRQIGQDMQVANEMMGGNHPDVTKWLILEYDMPQQEDG
ncbi:hypothetical protein ACQ4PT_056167 [Festuca glaucescens]